MKKLAVLVVTFGMFVVAFAQTPAPTDTVLPKKAKADTIIPEPKLKGGALIDTVNTEKNKYKLKPIHPGDSIHENKNQVGPKKNPI